MEPRSLAQPRRRPETGWARAAWLLPAIALLATWVIPAEGRTRRHHPRRRVVAAAPFPAASVTRSMEALLGAAFPSGAPAAAVLVSRGARVLVRRGYGHRGDGAATPATPFALGVVGEPMLADVVLQLAGEARLALADPIGRVVPGAPSAVTVEQLLTHTSGLADTADPGWCTGNAQTLGPSRFAPGTDWYPSSADYVLVARAIERAGGQPLGQALSRRLFTPLGMTASGCAGSGSAVPHGGGLVSSVDDLARWCAAQDGDDIVPHDVLERAITPTVLTDGRTTGCGYGLGLSTLNGHATIERAETGPDGSAALVRVPDQRVVVAVLSDRGGPEAQQLALRLAGLASGGVWSDPAVIPVEAAQLDRMTGSYVTASGERIAVTRDGSRLILQRGAGAAVEIEPQSANQFFVAGTDLRCEFVLAPGSPASQLILRRRIGPAETARRAEEMPRGN